MDAWYHPARHSIILCTDGREQASVDLPEVYGSADYNECIKLLRALPESLAIRFISLDGYAQGYHVLFWTPDRRGTTLISVPFDRWLTDETIADICVRIP